MSSIVRFTLGAALLAAGASPLAAEFNAETYHQSNCTRCHDTSVYTRENRQMRSYPMLESRVAGCDARFGEKLTPEGLTGLVDHLNDSYYKFDK
jgi:hypothetical protein